MKKAKLDFLQSNFKFLSSFQQRRGQPLSMNYYKRGIFLLIRNDVYQEQEWTNAGALRNTTSDTIMPDDPAFA